MLPIRSAPRPAAGNAAAAPASDVLATAAGDTAAVVAAAAFAALAAVGARRSGPHRRAQRRRHIVRHVDASTALGVDEAKTSPLTESGTDTGTKQLPLTLENVESVLDELRPYLRNDGGDCRVVEIDGPIVRLELQGACSSCSASSMTLKMGIERTLTERIPDIVEVVSVMPNEDPTAATPTEQGIEQVLNSVRPFLNTSRGTIKLASFSEEKVTLEMAGPAVKSMAVRVEVVNRIKQKYPMLKDVAIEAVSSESGAA